MDWSELADEITAWIADYAESNGISTLVIGVSGGIDSAVSSTLSAKTGLTTIVLNMPIHQDRKQNELSNKHISWLESNFDNVEGRLVDLTGTYDRFTQEMNDNDLSPLALANSRARLRMTTLYAIAGSTGGIVVGTGNKVEDFGVGFFTKYGDGGVDISPIADLMKSEVYEVAKALDIIDEIQQAAPTDGLWNDGRTDEEQIGATYTELEWAMAHENNPSEEDMTERQHLVLEIYRGFNKANSHKMNPIPIFEMKNRQ
ncbi:MAG: NAD(+) synthase [Euryarchaeota archaeon]|nr:NAD(+) synthase [Euryarchaeota archaeon]